MKQHSLDELKAEFKRLRYQWLPFMLIGERSLADEPDKFDDFFYLINGDVVKVFTGTTNPGSYWLQNFINEKFAATALLAPDQYLNTWKLGQIHGRDGFRQDKAVKIFRDGNKDLKSDEVGIPEWVGPELCLHIHAMFVKGASWKIWNWSAACQGLNQEVQWNEFMADCKKANITTLTYTLLHEFL